MLDLTDNQITDTGCATVLSALSSGLMPALDSFVEDMEGETLLGNPASAAALAAVEAALASRERSREPRWHG